MAASASMATLHSWKHESAKKAKEEILNAVGDVSKIALRAQQVLIGVYLRPATTSGKIITVYQSTNEDRWQGKVGLVIAVGPGAFPNGDIKAGDWVIHRAQDAWQCSIRGEGAKLSKERTENSEYTGWKEDDGWPCRFVYGDDIYAVTDDPAIIV